MSYQEIISNYLERRWEPAELNGGKFCEAVYSIINGAVKGSFPAKASKPSNMRERIRCSRFCTIAPGGYQRQTSSSG
jgi:hypothetical protein